MNGLHTLEMQSVILDYMSDSIFVHDMNGKFVYINKEAYESRGYTKDELLNMHVKDLDAPMDEESIKKMKNNIATMKKQGFVTFEIKHKTKDNQIIPVEIRSQIFNIENEKLVISVARDISDRQKVQNKLKMLASTDPLTTLYNRHKFELLFNSEVEKQQINKSSMSLLLIDLDYFKKINDSHGHNTGDKILVEFAKLLKTSLRTSDIIARWGGEEFIVLLPNCKLEQAENIAQELNRKTSEYNFTLIDKLTISIGLTEYVKDEFLSDFTSRADFALYNAKKLGRNRVEVSF